MDALAPDDAYDLVLVLVRADHLATVLPPLAANQRTPPVPFMVNSAPGPDALGRERVGCGESGRRTHRPSVRGAAVRMVSGPSNRQALAGLSGA